MTEQEQKAELAQAKMVYYCQPSPRNGSLGTVYLPSGEFLCVARSLEAAEYLVEVLNEEALIRPIDFLTGAFDAPLATLEALEKGIPS